MASTSIAFRPVVVACTATSGSITRRRTSSRANHHERRAQSNADRHPRLRRPPRGSSPTDGARGGYGARGRVQGCDGDAAGVRIGPDVRRGAIKPPRGRRLRTPDRRRGG